jgi:hypothetical protein
MLLRYIPVEDRLMHDMESLILVALEVVVDLRHTALAQPAIATCGI